jgi:hypothetical protein
MNIETATSFLCTEFILRFQYRVSTLCFVGRMYPSSLRVCFAKNYLTLIVVIIRLYN